MKLIFKQLLYKALDRFDFKKVETFFLGYASQRELLNKFQFNGSTSNWEFLHNLYHQAIPDRYSENLGAYKRQANFLSYEDLDKWTKGNYQNNMKDLNRFFFINLCIDLLLEENIQGNVAELGVFKGNSAHLLCKYATRVNTKCYLFDTFNGFDKKDLVNVDTNIQGQFFSNTSLDEVKSMVGETNTVFIKGYFPESLAQVEDISTFSLVHIDCDLEKPFRAGLNYFYPKLKRGGFLILHDHSSLYWPGATQAINDFFYDKPEFVIPIPDKSGTCVIRKM